MQNNKLQYSFRLKYFKRYDVDVHLQLSNKIRIQYISVQLTVHKTVHLHVYSCYLYYYLKIIENKF